MASKSPSTRTGSPVIEADESTARQTRRSAVRLGIGPSKTGEVTDRRQRRRSRIPPLSTGRTHEVQSLDGKTNIWPAATSSAVTKRAGLDRADPKHAIARHFTTGGNSEYCSPISSSTAYRLMHALGSQIHIYRGAVQRACSLNGEGDLSGQPVSQ